MYSIISKQDLLERFETDLANNSIESNAKEIPHSALTNQQISTKEAVTGLIIRELNNELSFLLTLRAYHLERHPGEVCLPGGHVEKNELHLEAVAREVEEEVGLSVDNIQWCSKSWDPLVSKSGTRVWPYLGFVKEPSSPLKLLRDEVEDAAWISLDKLFQKDLWTEDQYSLNAANSILRPRPVWTGWKHRSWGLTAGILALFVRRISGQIPY